MSPPRLWLLAVLVNPPLQDAGDAAAPRPELLLFIKARIFQNPLREAKSRARKPGLAGRSGEGQVGAGDAGPVVWQVCGRAGPLGLEDARVVAGLRGALLALDPQALQLMQAELFNAVVDEAGRGVLVGHGHLPTVQDLELLRVVEGVLIVLAGSGVLFHGSFG